MRTVHSAAPTVTRSPIRVAAHAGQPWQWTANADAVPDAATAARSTFSQRSATTTG
jgi:hypothetical protein